MNTNFLKIPLQVTKLIEGQELLVCTLKDSISQNLELIIMTRFGEHRYDFDFGCEIWDLDFELIVSENKWEEKLRQSLLQSITTHEDRLSEIQLSVKISEIEKQNLVRNYTEI
ncbi:MAG: GPW/gp25 family protein, partial [Bacteroidetes bacterium]|nr:GPW/gp25 family protein [Bacteroidota bacterium]